MSFRHAVVLVCLLPCWLSDLIHFRSCSQMCLSPECRRLQAILSFGKLPGFVGRWWILHCCFNDWRCQESSNSEPPSGFHSGSGWFWSGMQSSTSCCCVGNGSAPTVWVLLWAVLHPSRLGETRPGCLCVTLVTGRQVDRPCQLNISSSPEVINKINKSHFNVLGNYIGVVLLRLLFK